MLICQGNQNKSVNLTQLKYKIDTLDGVHIYDNIEYRQVHQKYRVYTGSNIYIWYRKKIFQG